MEVYTRVVGYMRPTNCMNPGKKEEIRMRKSMNIDQFKNKEEERPKKEATK